MSMLRKTLMLGLALLAAAAWAAPSFANLAIQGAVGQVSAEDGAALAPSIGFRIWSASPGGVTDVNLNVTSCTNVRCIRTYLTNALLDPGGYIRTWNAGACAVENASPMMCSPERNSARMLSVEAYTCRLRNPSMIASRWMPVASTLAKLWWVET